MLSAFLVLLLAIGGLIATQYASRGLRPYERGWLLGAASFHVVCSCALRFTQGNIYGAGDLGHFMEGSEPLVRLVGVDPVRWVPEVLKLLLQLPNDLSEDGSSTMSMIALTTIGRLLTDDSYLAMYVVLTFASLYGKWCIYRTYRDELEVRDSAPLLVATLLVPSVVFWSSGLVKETFAVIGVGLMTAGVARLSRVVSVGAVVQFAVGVVCTALFKVHFLFPFVAGAGVWLLLRRAKRVYVVPMITVAVALGLGAISALSAFAPRYAPDRLSESVAEAQVYGEAAGGGSYYSLGSPADRSPTAQLALAPVAALTTLARPLPFEARSGTSLVASFEMTVITLFALVTLRRLGLRATFTLVRSSPVLIFAAIMVVLCAAAVGLATTNFGTLSRYRAPMIPFYTGAIAAMHSRWVASRASERVGPTTRKRRRPLPA